MDQLLWLAQHPDLGSAIGEAKREADPFTRLDLAAELAGGGSTADELWAPSAA